MKFICPIDTVTTNPNPFFFATCSATKVQIAFTRTQPYFERVTSEYAIADMHHNIFKKIIEVINQHCEISDVTLYYKIIYPYLKLELCKSSPTAAFCQLNLLLDNDLVLQHWNEQLLPPAFQKAPVVKKYLEQIHTEFLLKVTDNYFPKLTDAAVTNSNHSQTLLFPHQLEGVQWMLQIEDSIQRSAPVGFISTHKPVFNDLFWNGTALTRITTEAEEGKVALFSKGGMIGDGIGSGKTLMLLNLIVHDLQTLLPLERPDVLQPCSLCTNATLIICGKQLAEQWKNQLKQHFGSTNEFRVVLITDKLHHERVTYESLLQAQFIIVTMSFLVGEYYRDNFVGQRVNATMVDSYQDFLYTKWPASLKLKPVLELIRYRRIVLDEADMYLSKLPFMDPAIEFKFNRKLTQHCRVNSSRKTEPFVYVNAFQSTFKWLVTSTPNLSEVSQQAAFSTFLQLSTAKLVPSLEQGSGTPRSWTPVQSLCLDTAMVGPSHLELWLFKQAFVQHLLVARSQEYVFSSMALPDLETDVIWIEFSTAEQNLVNSALELDSDYDYRRHVHAFPLSKDTNDESPTLSISQASDLMVETQRNRMVELEGSLQQLQGNLEEVERVRQSSPDVLVGVLNHRHTQISQEIQSVGNSLRAVQRSLQFLESSLQSTDPCSICLDGDTTMITQCGHKFCQPCLQRALHERPSCPTCRARVELNRCIRFVSQQSEGTQDYGSRFKALLSYVQQTKSEDNSAQFVVFSEWDKELKKQATLLSEAGFKCAQIKGNTATCTHHVLQFKAREIDVLFLSLQSMASGLNLETANHVIILTPLGEPFERADQIERQAIGRCHRVGQTRRVHVRHILVRNSLEQQIYERRTAWRNQQETKQE